MDKIIYPKELGMVLGPFELYELEQQLKRNNQIDNNTFIYIDDESNIRIKTIFALETFLKDSKETIKQKTEDLNNDLISEYTYHIELMERQGESSTVTYPKESPHKMDYPLGHPPRVNVNPYTIENKDLRIIGKRIHAE